MSVYRKIDTRIDLDAKFTALSNTAQFVFLKLIIHPQMTAIGAMRASLPGLAAEMRIEAGEFSSAFAEIQSCGMAEYDGQALCLFLPNFVKYQGAESPNVIKAWAKQVEWVPECPLRDKAVRCAKAFSLTMSEAFQKAFREAFREALPEDIPESVSSKQKAVTTSSTRREEGVPKTVIGDLEEGQDSDMYPFGRY